mmetsp:Transcript_55020/g.178841  ORF Transcript_55020/g.178841 Transcript_55020/m.178841 type:complete len:219 (-) Transcript_55020:187-843(-)
MRPNQGPAEQRRLAHLAAHRGEDIDWPKPECHYRHRGEEDTQELGDCLEAGWDLQVSTRLAQCLEGSCDDAHAVQHRGHDTHARHPLEHGEVPHEGHREHEACNRQNPGAIWPERQQVGQVLPDQHQVQTRLGNEECPDQTADPRLPTLAKALQGHLVEGEKFPVQALLHLSDGITQEAAEVEGEAAREEQQQRPHQEACPREEQGVPQHGGPEHDRD